MEEKNWYIFSQISSQEDTKSIAEALAFSYILCYFYQDRNIFFNER